jgi:hypothetical protein
LNKTVIRRSTYDILQFLGEIGGLEAVMLTLGAAIIRKISSFEVNREIFPQLYYERIRS